MMIVPFKTMQLVTMLSSLMIMVFVASNTAFAFTTHHNDMRRSSFPKPHSHRLKQTQIFSSKRGHEVFTEEELLAIAKEFAMNPTPDSMSEDFIFRGPVVGPLSKKDFTATLESVTPTKEDGSKLSGLEDAFPDYEPNNFGFCIDPTEPDRVWYFSRGRGTFSGPFDHPVVGRIEPTGAPLISPPEARSFIIDADGKIKYNTVGYITDRFTGDTTGGKGAVFGLYAVMGQEIDDTIGSIYLRFIQWLPSLFPNLPKSYSKKEDLPTWWKDPRMGADK